MQNYFLSIGFGIFGNNCFDGRLQKRVCVCLQFIIAFSVVVTTVIGTVNKALPLTVLIIM